MRAGASESHCNGAACAAVFGGEAFGLCVAMLCNRSDNLSGLFILRAIALQAVIRLRVQCWPCSSKGGLLFFLLVILLVLLAVAGAFSLCAMVPHRGIERQTRPFSVTCCGNARHSTSTTLASGSTACTGASTGKLCVTHDKKALQQLAQPVTINHQQLNVTGYSNGHHTSNTSNTEATGAACYGQGADSSGTPAGVPSTA